MWEWLASKGWHLLVALVIGAYFVLHVAAIRSRRSTGGDKPRLPCDRC